MPRVKFMDRMETYFKAHPGQWIDGKDLEVIGGRYAWRSRVSDCRTQRGMTIENRQRHLKAADGTRYTVSEYRFLPHVPIGPESTTPRLHGLF